MYRKPHHHTHDECTCPRRTALRGLLSLAILNLLKDKSMYGAEICKNLLERFNVNVPRAVVYGLLRRMESFGLVTSTWDTEGGGPARRVYRITEEGLEYLRKSVKNLRNVKKVIDILLAESDEG